MSNNKKYSYTFSKLVDEILEFKGWEKEDLANATCFCERTLSRCLSEETTDKITILSICVALGLDLVSTMIFLLSRGFILNPINNRVDRKYMTFIYENSAKDKEYFEDGFNRIIKCNEYIQDKKFLLGGSYIK